MAEPIGPGDMLECVETHGAPLVLGAVYQVREVTPESKCGCITAGVRPWAFAHIGIRLADAPDPTGYRYQTAWCSYLFKPISRRQSFETFLAQLKTPVPVPEHETA